MTRLRLELRTPSGLLVSQDVRSITAEDLDGWFGIAPGRSDLVAVLPPGLLSFRDDEGECFVALAGGLLDLHDGRCRVAAREAVLTRSLDEVADRVEQLLDYRKQRRAVQRQTLTDLIREAERRLAREVRS